MLRATTIVRKAAVRPDRIAETVTLDHAARRLVGEIPLQAGDLAFLAAPAKATQLEDGDALRLEDGRLVLVRAAEEALLAVRADNPARLLRLAGQFGSNHVAAEVDGDVLYVAEAAASAELARNAGCAAAPVRRSFRPEPEVHAHDHATCGHDHGHHHHGHDHAHHDHAHHDHAHRDGHDHHHHDH